jgi:hypothetical protein
VGINNSSRFLPLTAYTPATLSPLHHQLYGILTTGSGLIIIKDHSSSASSIAVITFSSGNMEKVEETRSESTRKKKLLRLLCESASSLFHFIAARHRSMDPRLHPSFSQKARVAHIVNGLLGCN